MRLAIVLPSLIQTPERARLADLCFQTLSKTKIGGLAAPQVIVLSRPSPIKYDYYKFLRGSKMPFTVMHQPPGMDGSEEPLPYGTEYAMKLGFTHMMWTGEDTLYHPDWLLQLDGLIERHPEARAWSVYRSAHEAYHKTLALQGEDVLVRSLCGVGLTFSVAEWVAWDITPEEMLEIKQINTTLDLLHKAQRPGERWCSNVSYIEHTGRVGSHTHPEAPEWAIKFQGIGE